MEIKIIREIDELGRIVIPRDARRELCIGCGDKLEITVENGAIILKKSEAGENE